MRAWSRLPWSGMGEIADQFVSGDEAGFGAVLDGPVGDGDDEVRLAGTGRTGDVMLTDPVLSAPTLGIRSTVVS